MTPVSVIIPTYNYGRFVADAVISAQSQTLKPIEIIVVDDGSTDGTEDVVRGLGEQVRYIKQHHAGVCSARNRGVIESRGKLLAFLDSDDTWEPTKLEKQAAKFACDYEIGLVHCGMREFASESNATIRTYLDGDEGWVAGAIALWERPVIIGPGGSIMVSRVVFDEVGGFDERLTNGEDWEFCLRVARKYKIGFVAEPLVNYRNHGTNATKNVRKMERSTLIAWKKAFAIDDPEIQKLKRRSYGNLHKVLAGSYLHSRQFYGFIRNLVKSLWYRPSYLGYYFKLLFTRRNSGE